MTSDQVRKQLQRFVDDCGSQTEAAKAIGVSLPYLNDVLRGKRTLGPKILVALGLQKGYFKVKS